MTMHRFRLWLSVSARAFSLAFALALCLNGLAAQEHVYNGKAHPAHEICLVCAAYDQNHLGLTPTLAQAPGALLPEVVAVPLFTRLAKAAPAPFQARAPPAV